MADMSAIMALQKAERLVSTVARAFYTDLSVLVVDTLIREKCVSVGRSMLVMPLLRCNEMQVVVHRVCPGNWVRMSTASHYD